jgi:hypothetical protein
MALAWIVGGILIGLVAIILAVRWLARPALVLAAKPERIELVQYETEPLALILRRRTWRGGAWTDVGGTYLLSAQHGGVFSLDPPRGGSHPRNSMFSVSLTGIVPGHDELIVSATPLGETKACVGRFPVAVTPNPEGDRRLRQNAASLKAK